MYSSAEELFEHRRDYTLDWKVSAINHFVDGVESVQTLNADDTWTEADALKAFRTGSPLVWSGSGGNLWIYVEYADGRHELMRR